MQSPEGVGSGAGSRHSSRRGSLKKEPSLEDTPSPTLTPKRTQKAGTQKIGGPDFLVTGKQIVKRCDRANSLPGTVRRPSTAAGVCNPRARKLLLSATSRSQETSLEDDMSLDLSQVSDFEDTNSKHGPKPLPLATSTPKPRLGPKPRSSSVQSHISHLGKRETKMTQMSLDKSKDSTLSYSRESLYKTTSSSASPYRYGTELDYSSVSPEYSGQSSAELSPRTTTDLALSPRSQASSWCVSTWREGSEGEPTRVEAPRPVRGEDGDFWTDYNHPLAKVPMKSYYDQCPTPYRTENIDLNDFDLSNDGSRKRSPDNIKNINNIIRNEGLQLTPRETQNIIKCAHILGNVLSKAIERRTRENDHETKIEEIKTGNTAEVEKEIEIKKKNLTLDLKETALPIRVVEEKRSETVMTQTDISLPNTKSAPIIFERILKQLSKNSIDEGDEDDDVFAVKDKK